MFLNQFCLSRMTSIYVLLSKELFLKLKYLSTIGIDTWACAEKFWPSSFFSSKFHIHCGHFPFVTLFFILSKLYFTVSSTVVLTILLRDLQSGVKRWAIISSTQISSKLFFLCFSDLANQHHLWVIIELKHSSDT